MRPSLSAAITALLAFCLAFGWWQNTAGLTGGPISPAKTLWLFLALTFFYLLPAWQAADRSLPAPEHRFWRLFLACWLIRGLIEVPLLLTTRLWRCEYGIAHTLTMLAFLAVRAAPGPLRTLTALALGFEALNAFLFSRTGNPAAGQYFAGSDPVFRWVNFITWLEILVLLPPLILWISRSRRPS